MGGSIPGKQADDPILEDKDWTNSVGAGSQDGRTPGSDWTHLALNRRKLLLMAGRLKLGRSAVLRDVLFAASVSFCSEDGMIWDIKLCIVS